MAILPHVQITMRLHFYRPRLFQWTSFGVNWPSDCWVLASARSQEPLSHPWACPSFLLGKLPWRCASTGQEGSNKLDLELTKPVDAEFYLMFYSLHHNVLPILQSIPLMTIGFLLPRPAYNASKPMIIPHDQFPVAVFCMNVCVLQWRKVCVVVL